MKQRNRNLINENKSIGPRCDNKLSYNSTRAEGGESFECSFAGRLFSSEWSHERQLMKAWIVRNEPFTLVADVVIKDLLVNRGWP